MSKAGRGAIGTMNKKDCLQYMETHKDTQVKRFDSIAEAQSWVFSKKR